MRNFVHKKADNFSQWEKGRISLRMIKLKKGWKIVALFIAC